MLLSNVRDSYVIQLLYRYITLLWLNSILIQVHITVRIVLQEVNRLLFVYVTKETTRWVIWRLIPRRYSAINNDPYQPTPNYYGDTPYGDKPNHAFEVRRQKHETRAQFENVLETNQTLHRQQKMLNLRVYETSHLICIYI